MSSNWSRALAARASCAVALCSLLTHAADRPTCEEEISRANLVACAQVGSPALGIELASVRSAEGRREAARPFLPANPMLSGSLASRVGPEARAINWSLTLAQEFELAGQSGLRVAEAEAELVSHERQLEAVRAELAEQVWLAWFETLSAQERVALASRLEQASLAVAKTAQAMAANGLASEVDATVADAAGVAASQHHLEARREAAAAALRLRALLGATRTPRLAGVLEPLQVQAEPGGERPELAALRALERAAEKRLELLRRSRVPNATLSAFIQNDGFDERVLGVGLGVPIPLPQPLGRTKAGEVADAVGAAERSRAELEKLTRALTTERELAREAYQASVEARALYSGERRDRAAAALAAIATQLSAARLQVRDALLAQQTLMQLLEAELEARHALCAASVRLRRATGASLEGGDL